ncbi:MAG: T9SS type A sorting domain-containing protein [Candidatus Eisenbacteria sp.]|nr:T9SS type A sorting domain-containing protein [Candidatus Eisenbacteria bacterium]
MRRRSMAAALWVMLALICVAASFTDAIARNPIRNDFFSLYSDAENTQLDDLPSNAGHCGVCHFDFDGGGARNPYGLGVQVGINGGLSNTEAFQAIAGNDSDADGFTNLVEITDVINFANTPTFPGLAESNKDNVVNIPVGEIEPYLTPSGGSDTTPPDVTVLAPNGGEVLNANAYYSISYTATDASGVSYIDFYLSDDEGGTYKPFAAGVTPGTSYSWFVPNRPGDYNLVRVEAVDNAANPGSDESDAAFTILARPPGYVPSTMRDMDMLGTQPLEGAILDDPGAVCASCHGNYDTLNEPWYNWRGSMMGQAARDPFFFACMTIAEQDAPSVGDLCIRCHSPGGWQGGRSVDTSAGLLNETDRHGVQCDYCHREVDHQYVEGVSPAEDVAVLATVDPLPLQYGNGQFISDPAPVRRGPYADAVAAHAFLDSPIHRSANMCGICHDVSNPVFTQSSPGDYVPTAFDEEHPDMDVRNMFPVERTYSEWSQSEYATSGVYAPQFAGNKPDGIVSTCQDCHMRDVEASGADGGPVRTDLGLHDLMGGNTFVPDIIASFFPDEVDVAQLQAAKGRAEEMLIKAAMLELTPEDFGVTVRVTNETGHKLPSGYPEGRRIWLHVEAFDEAEQTVFESGAYDPGTAELIDDEQRKVYEIHPGLSPGLAVALGIPGGKSFHFVLSDTVYFDNRIPPRGFSNAGFTAVQSPPVDYSYADGQYWDETAYTLPVTAVTAEVTLYYQSTSKEYIEFLRDENTTNSAGQDLYDAWVAQGKAPPVAMATASTPVTIIPSAIGGDEGSPGEGEGLSYRLSAGFPNPFAGETRIRYALPREEPVRLTVHDVAGRLVRVLFDGTQPAGVHDVTWDGSAEYGERVSSGIYYVRYRAGLRELRRQLLLLQ